MRLSLCRLLLLFLFVCASKAEAYTPFYELSAPTRMGSGTTLLGGHVDVATGAFCFQKHLVTVSGYPSIAQDIYFHSQDSSNGPFGKGTSTSYDWFVTHSTTWPGSPWVLIGPGNHHFIFDSGSSGLYTDPRDPSMLGAALSFNAPPGGDLCVITFKNHDRWEFDTSGGLIAIHTHCTNSGSNTLTIQRDSATGFVTYVYQTLTPTMRATHFNYSGSPAVCTQMDIDYNYTWGVSAGTTRTWTFTYTGSNTRLATLTDVQGRVSSINWTTYTRSDGAVLPLVQNMVDNRGNTTIGLTYDSSGRVISGALPVSGVITYGWNGAIGTASYVTVTLPGGHAYNISWQWHTANTGYWVDVVHDLTLAAYTAFEKNAGPTYLNTAVTDYLSHRYTLTWDSAEGNLLSYSYPTATGGTATYTYQYDSVFHKLTTTTDPLGNVTRQAVDPNTGDMTSRTDAAGNITRYLYTTQGSCYQVTDPLGHHRNSTYDLITGTKTSDSDALGHMTTYGLDVIGNIVSVTGPTQHVVNYGYNNDNSLASISQTVQGVPITQVYARDGNDNILSCTDANGHVWTAAFDAANRTVSSTNPLGVSRTWSYNPDNTINVYSDPLGQTCTMVYDAAGRPTSQTCRVAGGGTVESTIAYTYDPTTQLLSSLNDSAFGTATLVRDGILQAISTTQPAGTVSRTYDVLGRPATETLSGQPAVSYHYNSLGLMDSETQNSLTTTFVYDANGRLIAQQFPNGVTVTRVLDATGAVLRATSTRGASTLDDTVYSRDALGNVKTSQANGGTQVNYTYDDLNRITSISSPADFYQYDNVGNPTIIQLNGGSEHFYSYDAANTLIRIDGTAVAANAAGATTSYNGTAYTWDVRGRLTSYTAAGVAAAFKYFPTGLPAQQTINGTVTNIVMSGSDVLGEITGGVTTTTLNSPSFGTPVSRGGLYHSTDGLGNTTALTDSAGTVVQNYTYTPLGVVTKTTGTDSPYQFRGSYNAGFGLDRMGTALYDPVHPPLLAQASGGMGPAGGMGGMQWSGGRFGPTGLPVRSTPESEGHWVSENMGKTTEVIFKPGWDKGLTAVDPKAGIEPIEPGTVEPVSKIVGDVVGNRNWTGERAGPGDSNLPNVVEGPIDGPPQFQKITWRPRPPLPGENPPPFGPDPLNPGNVLPEEATGGGGASGAFGAAFMLVTPNPFNGGETPLDTILNFIFPRTPPRYDAALEAAIAADIAGTNGPMIPSDGPGSPLIPWPPS